MRQIVLDTETTGLSFEQGHRVIEVGAIELVNRQKTRNHFHYYLNPERDIEFAAQEVHGITSEFLQDKPLFKDIAEEFLQFVQGAELIIHNAPFDVSFINGELKLVDTQFTSIANHCSVLDTLLLARKKHPGLKNSLDALCRRYNVDNSGRELHGALLDAELLADVYLLMTGGQTSLFIDDLQTDRNHAAAVTIDKPKTRQPLLIIKPSVEELTAHAEFLQQLQTHSDAGVFWQDAE